MKKKKSDIKMNLIVVLIITLLEIGVMVMTKSYGNPILLLASFFTILIGVIIIGV